MRKTCMICIILLQVTGLLFAQKKPLDNASLLNWPNLNSTSISNDGRFIIYAINIPGIGSNLIVQSTNGAWRYKLFAVNSGIFTPDSKSLIFKNSRDSVGRLELGTSHINYITNVNNFKLSNNGEWLIYRSNDSEMSLIIKNLISGSEKHFSDISEYLLSKNGQVLVMKKNIKEDEKQKAKVLWFSFADTTAKVICQIDDASYFTFNHDNTQLLFFTTDRKNVRSLRFYKPGMGYAHILVDSTTSGMEGKIINGKETPLFSANDEQIFFLINTAGNRSINNSNINATVDIRGIHDDDLDLKRIKNGPLLAVLNLNTFKKKVLLLQQKGDKIIYNNTIGNWVIANSNVIGDYTDYKWKISVRPDVYLISTIDGSRRLLKRRSLFSYLSFSLSQNYIIWFDREQKQWFANNLKSNTTKNISRGLRTLFYQNDDHPDLAIDEGVMGWFENDSAVLIYDRYDIWQLDPNGIKAPVNITKGFGVKNNIRFRYVDFNSDDPETIRKSDTLLLSAFDQTSKSDGFFSLAIANRTLKKLILTQNCYNYQEPTFSGAYNPSPFSPIIKAKSTNKYMLARMSATEYPNLYFTSNFHDFVTLTTLAPQKEYNWYTTDLIHWKLPDGKFGEGILYKPENFDPLKKYPMIFYYYEQNSFALHDFIFPALSNGEMNIPWFVSNGYLVFVPDIRYKIGYPGQSACDAVVSAANYLSKKPWVDAKRMGLQGHSFGGFETNYIVGHSTLFAAAASASAVSNIVSAYGELDYGTWFHERRQARIGATLWQRPDLYIGNSPVFKADKVMTPLLIMHTVQDGMVPYSQALQWYNDLHRLGKKVWLLSYDGERHVLWKKENRLDYSIRLGQFFDYYLKGSLPPKWMSQGVDRSIKDDGLELDNSGIRP